MINKKEITLVIADDHPLLLKGLYEELLSHNYNVLGKAENGMQALELILTQKPTIALLDIDMPMLTGLEVISIAKEKHSLTKFILLSFHKEQDFVTQAKSLNIMGYLLKEDSFLLIEKCLNSVANNIPFYSPSFDKKIIEGSNSELKALGLLSPSELKILKYIAENLSTQRISEALFISTRTVDKHRSNIINKLSITKETNALTNWALLNKEIIFNL